MSACIAGRSSSDSDSCTVRLAQLNCSTSTHLMCIIVYPKAHRPTCSSCTREHAYQSGLTALDPRVATQARPLGHLLIWDCLACCELLLASLQDSEWLIAAWQWLVASYACRVWRRLRHILHPVSPHLLARGARCLRVLRAENMAYI